MVFFLLDVRTITTVWFFRTITTVWYFRTITTVWYFLFFIFIPKAVDNCVVKNKS